MVFKTQRRASTTHVGRPLRGGAQIAGLKKAGHIFRFVFFRELADRRGGPKAPRQILKYAKAWKAATIAAGAVHFNLWDHTVGLNGE